MVMMIISVIIIVIFINWKNSYLCDIFEFYGVAKLDQFTFAPRFNKFNTGNFNRQWTLWSRPTNDNFIKFFRLKSNNIYLGS